MEPMAPDWRAIGGPHGQPATPPTTGSVRPSLPARHLAWLVGGLSAALLVGALGALLVMPAPGGVLVDAHDTSTALRPATDLAGGTVSADLAGLADPTSATLVVDVEGAVGRPGLVRVPAGARVADAIDLAGGYGPTVDLAAAAATLNLAQEVTDGLKVVVPAIGDTPVAAPGGGVSAQGAGGGLVDLNQGTEAELDSLPGVGPATIAKIVAARAEAPFRSVDELRSRGVVGEATLAKLRDLVTVGR